jgi:hypothetical protein
MQSIKSSDILKRARDYLWDGHGNQMTSGKNMTMFVCLAINRAAHAYDYYDVYLAERALCADVSRRIGGHSIAEDYLATKRRFFFFRRYYTRRQVQAFRRTLLETMIAEYEAKGD